LSIQTYSPGEIIYYEGEQADDYLYFIEEGTSKWMAIPHLNFAYIYQISKNEIWNIFLGFNNILFVPSLPPVQLFHVIEKYDDNDEKNHLVFETI